MTQAGNEAIQLDTVWHNIIFDIEGRLPVVEKLARVRLQAWLKKLSASAPQSSTIWRRNRNAFARLMLEMLRQGRIAEPFHTLPPDGPLPKFNPEMAYLYIQRHESPPRGVSPGPDVSKGAQRAVAEPSRISATETRVVPDASATLSHYLQQQQQPEELPLPPRRNHSPRTRSASPPAPRLSAVARRAQESHRVVGGFDAAFAIEEAQRHRGWLEAEAELGAARERLRELERRTRQQQETLDAQRAEIDRLRRLLEDAHAERAKEAHRQELDHLLAQFDNVSVGQPVRWAERPAQRGGGAGATAAAAGPRGEGLLWHGHSGEEECPRQSVPVQRAARAGGGARAGLTNRAKAHFGVENLTPVLVQAALQARPALPGRFLTSAGALCREGWSMVEKGREADSEAEFSAYIEDFQRATERLRARVAAAT